MSFAIELKHTSSNDNNKKSFLHHYEKEELTKYTESSYGFKKETPSVVEFGKQTYKPVRIHLTKPLFKLNRNHYSHEMIVEHEVYNEKSKMLKLFVCIPLIEGTGNITFPLEKEIQLDNIFENKENVSYQTKTKNYVLVFTKPVEVSGNLPSIRAPSKTSYKEIIEPDSFDVMSSIITLSDNQTPQLSILGKNHSIEKKLMQITEGFAVDRPREKTGAYMDCELLEENEDDGVYKDYAVIPLNATSANESLSILLMFLIFICVIIGGVIVGAFLNFESVKKTFTKIGIAFIIGAFFLASLLCIICGFAVNKTIVTSSGMFLLIAGSSILLYFYLSYQSIWYSDWDD